jgi:hypothetical protein
MWMVMVIILFYGGRDEFPLVFISIGVIFQLANIVIGVFTWTHVAAASIPIMFVIAGILVAWHRYRG